MKSERGLFTDAHQVKYIQQQGKEAPGNLGGECPGQGNLHTPLHTNPIQESSLTLTHTHSGSTGQEKQVGIGKSAQEEQIRETH